VTVAPLRSALLQGGRRDAGVSDMTVM